MRAGTGFPSASSTVVQTFLVKVKCEPCVVYIPLKKLLELVSYQAALEAMSTNGFGVVQTLSTTRTPSLLTHASVRMQWGSKTKRLPDGLAATATMVYCRDRQECETEVLSKNPSGKMGAGAGAGAGGPGAYKSKKKEVLSTILTALSNRVGESPMEEMRIEELMTILSECSGFSQLCTFPPHVHMHIKSRTSEEFVPVHVAMRPGEDASTPVPVHISPVRVMESTTSAAGPRAAPATSRGSSSSSAAAAATASATTSMDVSHSRLITAPGFTQLWEDNPAQAEMRGLGFHGNLMPYIRLVSANTTDAPENPIKAETFVFRLVLSSFLPATDAAPSVDHAVLERAFKVRWLHFLSTQVGMETVELARIKGIVPHAGATYIEASKSKTPPLTFSPDKIAFYTPYGVVHDAKLASLRTPLMTLSTATKFVLAVIKEDHLNGTRIIPSDEHTLVVEVVQEVQHTHEDDSSRESRPARPEHSHVDVLVTLTLAAENTAALCAAGRIPRLRAVSEFCS